ncbi:MAG: 5-(carboxyamino)imidazole ribonucleotide mutase [Bacteroidota bacterium]|nr:5-(carboxyamino)imidazole ribonucleotide mutase [Bacteroidota bacterium]
MEIIFSKTNAKVSIIMGSISDKGIMQAAADILIDAGVPIELDIISAHRTPDLMMEYAKQSKIRGIQVIIAGAGGAAHLPGMVASCTALPVIGVPIKSSNSIDGWDSVLSILQMPTGIPVATVALNAAANAGLLAIRILALHDEVLNKWLDRYVEGLKAKVEIMRNDVKL